MPEEVSQFELLSAYLDDELTPADRARVEQRLASDKQYAMQLEALQTQRDQLRQALPGNSPPGLGGDFAQRVMDQVDATQQNAVSSVAPRPSGGLGRNRFLLAAGSLAALLLVSLFLFLPDNQETQTVMFDAAKADVESTAIDAEELSEDLVKLEEEGMSLADAFESETGSEADDELAAVEVQQPMPASGGRADSPSSFFGQSIDALSKRQAAPADASGLAARARRPAQAAAKSVPVPAISSLQKPSANEGEDRESTLLAVDSDAETLLSRPMPTEVWRIRYDESQPLTLAQLRPLLAKLGLRVIETSSVETKLGKSSAKPSSNNRSEPSLLKLLVTTQASKLSAAEDGLQQVVRVKRIPMTRTDKSDLPANNKAPAEQPQLKAEVRLQRESFDASSDELEARQSDGEREITLLILLPADSEPTAASSAPTAPPAK